MHDIYENHMPVGYYKCFDDMQLGGQSHAAFTRWKNPFEPPKPIHFHSNMSLEEERRATAIFDLTTVVTRDLYESALKLYPKRDKVPDPKSPYHDLDQLLEQTLLQSASLAKEAMKRKAEIEKIRSMVDQPK